MTSPIVKRLRRLADKMARFLGPPEMAPSPNPDDLTEAADEIERLSAELARAREVLRPFAVQSDKIHSGYDDGIAAGDHPMWHVFVSDLRAARRLYEKESGR